MNNAAAFVLGLLIGWLVEWIIDWFYWRKRVNALEVELSECRSQSGKSFSVEKAQLEADMDNLRVQSQTCATQKAQLEADLASCKARAEAFTAEKAQLEARIAELELQASESATRLGGLRLDLPDNLEDIKGIGPKIAGMLRDAGITTFAALGALTVEDLRRLLGTAIQRLADEEDILAQARELAAKRH